MKLDKSILINILPGLLPLFIFILADSLWGTIIGLYVAIGFGFAELLFTYILSGKFEKFILIDTGLLIVLGAISILLENEIFFKLKPAFIELIFAAILGLSAFSRRNFIFEMSRRYVKDFQLSPSARRKMTNNVKILFYITIAHIILVVYSAYYMSKEAWAFISGVLYYLIIVGYFIFEIIRSRLILKKAKGEEQLPVVDEDGNIKGFAPRSAFHFNDQEKLLHPVVHMHIINLKGEIYLQHRSETKKVQPGKWDTSVGGHISYGETLEQALVKEAREETGLLSFNPQYIEKYIWETEIEKELVFTFMCVTDHPLRIEDGEASDGKFWKIKDIRKSLAAGVFTPNFEHEFKILEQRKIIR